jgi:hypothetical protein
MAPLRPNLITTQNKVIWRYFCEVKMAKTVPLEGREDDFIPPRGARALWV